MACISIDKTQLRDKRYRLKLFSAFAVVFLLIILIAVVIIVWTMPDLVPTDGSRNICLHVEGAVKCTETVTTMKDILEKEIIRVYKETSKQDDIDSKEYFSKNVNVALKNDYLASIPDMKPSAKLVGISAIVNVVKPQMKEMETVLAWYHGRDLDYTSGFLRYGVRYQNGRLIVPLTGTYNIYSFLSLTEESESKDDLAYNTNATTVKHAMYRFNVKLGNDEELAMSIQTHRQPKHRNFNAFSTQMSTLVHLQAGDEVSVKVSNISLLRHAGDNFFGLHMI